jgi:hypothetical protein
MRRLRILAVLGLAIGPASCGGDGDDEGGGTSERAEAIAACAERAGFDPTVSKSSEPGATAVDLTTRTATIVVQVFESAEDAAAYDPSLEAERVGSTVILGGAIPPEALAKVKDCISES